MNIAFIGCMVLSREISYEVSRSSNNVRTWWLRQDLHNTPEKLKKLLQKTIDEIEEENRILPEGKGFDYICLGYGLCSDSVVGLENGKIPLVIPKCDDCISLFLGSIERYRELFGKHPGTYWYTPGWIENAFTPSKESYERLYEEYVKEYGEDNAKFLMEAENSWNKEYDCCAYIESPIYKNEKYIEYTKAAAEYLKWEFKYFEGKSEFFEKMLNGPWDEKDFCICGPESKVTRVYDERRLIGVER